MKKCGGIFFGKQFLVFLLMVVILFIALLFYNNFSKSSVLKFSFDESSTTANLEFSSGYLNSGEFDVVNLVFVDGEGKEYYYDLFVVSGEKNYIVPSTDVGLTDFSKIVDVKIVGVVKSLGDGAGSNLLIDEESPFSPGQNVLRNTTLKPTSGGGSSGGGGGGSSGGSTTVTPVVVPCVSNCDGKFCGSDGCSGSCGECSGDAVCLDFRCLNNVFYVSVTGAGNRNGIINNEFNLSEAITYSYANQDEEINFLLEDGNYGSFIEDTNLGVSYLIYRNYSVTYKSVNPRGAVFDSITVRNIDKWGEIKHGTSKLLFDGLKVLDGVGLFYTTDIEIKNCEITKKAQSILGVYAPYVWQHANGIMGDNVQDLRIIGNEIHQVYRGIYNVGNNTLIKNNLVYDKAEDGIDFGGNHVIIENNTIHSTNAYKTAVSIYGQTTGEFNSFDAVVQENTGAVGIVQNIVDRDGYKILNVWQTTEKRFVLGNNLSSIIGSKFWDVTKVDPTHTDGIQIDSRNLTNISIIGNKIYGDLYGYNGIKVGREIYDVKIIGNLVYNTSMDGGLLYGNKNLEIINNTIDSRCRFIASDTDFIVSKMQGNIFKMILIEESNGFGVNFLDHKENIFGSNPVGIGVISPFVVDVSERVNFNLDALFIERYKDYTPLKNSSVCNGSLNGKVGQAIGVIPCSSEINVNLLSGNVVGETEGRFWKKWVDFLNKKFINLVFLFV